MDSRIDNFKKNNMDDFILYLLKSAVWLSGFAIVYMIFLQRERFFILKRIYLVTGIVASFFLPLITIHYQVEIPSPTLTPVVPMPYDQYNPGQIVLPVPQQNEFNYLYLLAGIYLSGIIFLFVRNLIQFRHLLKAIKKSNIHNHGGAKLIRTSDYVSSFSFFNYVFVNPSVSENEVKEIMNHELVHVQQKHWFDLALGEFLRMLQWANPFAWIYTGFIRLNHEYLADQEALQRSSDPALYKAALLNQLFRTPVISLSNSFNYSITKTRFDMMKKITTSPYRKLKVLLILPVFAIILYAFSAPEYSYVAPGENSVDPLTIYESTPVKPVAESPQTSLQPADKMQQGVKGRVTDADGKPVPGAVVAATGAAGAPPVTTDKDGNFSLPNVPGGISLFVSAPGFKGKTIKPLFDKPMEISLEKDPGYISQPVPQMPDPLVIIDGEVTDIKFSDIRKELGHNLGPVTMLSSKEAIEKYGEKGAKGVAEVLTRKKALEMGMKVPYPRIGPEDFPSFLGENYMKFNSWVAERVTYPEEAKTKGMEGWITVNYTVQPDGNVTTSVYDDESKKALSNEIIRVINMAPKFEPPKNPESNEPFSSSITIGFLLPDQVIREAPFVLVESMPVYPGGNDALLQFIKENTKYPEELKEQKIEGRVILRFIVTPKGTTDGISVIKGVHSLMDAEAVRIVKSLKGWEPGTQGGRAVSVWYMVPVNFTPPGE